MSDEQLAKGIELKNSHDEICETLDEIFKLKDRARNNTKSALVLSHEPGLYLKLDHNIFGKELEDFLDALESKSNKIKELIQLEFKNL